MLPGGHGERAGTRRSAEDRRRLIGHQARIAKPLGRGMPVEGTRDSEEEAAECKYINCEGSPLLQVPQSSPSIYQLFQAQIIHN
jgi:hypothetical protein